MCCRHDCVVDVLLCRNSVVLVKSVTVELLSSKEHLYQSVKPGFPPQHGLQIMYCTNALILLKCLDINKNVTNASHNCPVKSTFACSMFGVTAIYQR